jgi:hypothetical protein
MHFLCKTSHKDSCAWPCLTWHCHPIKSAEYNQWSPLLKNKACWFHSFIRQCHVYYTKYYNATCNAVNTHLFKTALNLLGHSWKKSQIFNRGSCKNLLVFTLNFLPYKPTGPVSSNIYRPTNNSTGPNLKTTLMTINSNHQNSKHDDVLNIMWTCQLCIR